MDYDPNDFQDQAAVLAALQRQRQLELSSRKKVIPENRACPWCGGELPGVVKKCMHCASDVSWFEGKPCIPENLEQLKEESQRREEHTQQLEKYQNEKTQCRDCKCEFRRKDLTHGICLKCTSKSGELGCLIIFLLLVMPLLYFGWDTIKKGFPDMLELGFFSILPLLGILSLIFIITLSSFNSILCGVLSLIILLIIIAMILGNWYVVW